MSSREIKYAPYLEAAHSSLLGTNVPISLPLIAAFNAQIGQAPDIDKPNVSNIYIGVNKTVLFDVFKTVMLDLDITNIFDGILRFNLSTIFDERLKNRIIQEQDVYKVKINKLCGEFRSINAIQSSAFIISKAIIYASYVRKLTTLESLKVNKLIKLEKVAYRAKLAWNKSVSTHYAFITKDLIERQQLYDDRYMLFKVRKEEWDLKLLGNYVAPHMNPGGFGQVQNVEGGLDAKALAEETAATVTSIIVSIYGTPIMGAAAYFAVKGDCLIRQKYGAMSFIYTGGLSGPGLIWDWAWDTWG